MNPEMDAHLTKCGVYFLPWIGETYESGFGGRRLLILGESHYTDWENEDGIRERHLLSERFTRDCVYEIFKREGGAPLWRYIEQAFFNEHRINGWAPSGGKTFWNQMAFYNFVQAPVEGGPNVRPTAKQFRDSWGLFRTVLETLRPERVLVCGKILWGWREPTPHDLNSGDADAYLRGDVQAYRLTDGTPIWCLAMTHPSRGFSWPRWHPVISAFLQEPRHTPAY